jgi:hypothetical protein
LADNVDYLAQQFMPGTGYHIGKVIRAARGQQTQLGQNETVGGAITNAFVKMPKVNPDEEIAKRARKLKGEMHGYDAIIQDRVADLRRGQATIEDVQATAVKYNGLKQQAAQTFGEYLRRIQAAKGARK